MVQRKKKTLCVDIVKLKLQKVLFGTLVIGMKIKVKISLLILAIHSRRVLLSRRQYFVPKFGGTPAFRY